jgi:hypothetical protein
VDKNAVKNNRPYRPLAFPSCLGVRCGHFLLIAMMLPMLLILAIVGFITGGYRRALRHAVLPREQ